jgi:hypothetical protein
LNAIPRVVIDPAVLGLRALVARLDLGRTDAFAALGLDAGRNEVAVRGAEYDALADRLKDYLA